LTDSLSAENLFNIQGRKVFLTGASGFLGRTFARTLLVNGAHVVLVGFSERFDQFVKQATDEFEGRISSYRADLDDTNRFRGVLETIVEREGTMDVIVNNAHMLGARTGFNSVSGLLENASKEQVAGNLAGGIVWPLLAVQVLGRGMIERRHGSIINVASMYAVVAPNPKLYQGTDFLNPVGYSVAKAGMLAFTRYVASFWGQYNIRCNALLPGAFSNTEEETENSVRLNDPFTQRLVDRTSLNRLGRPFDLSGALLFLASDASSYMTGQSLIVDGGWTIT